MKRWLLWIFAGIGALAVVLIMFVTGYVLLDRYKEVRPRAKDLAYILNWGKLGEHTQIVRVVQSCVTPRNRVVGDQTLAYQLEIAPVPSKLWDSAEIAEFWTRGPIEEPLVKDALQTANIFAKSAGCQNFPDLNSSRFWLSFPKITAYDRQVEGVQVTAYDTISGHVYHADVHW